MPVQIIRHDITKMRVDAIVNAANTSLLGGGGVDGCIHNAAGPELFAECKMLGGCEVGQAKITGAYKLPCKYVIHAVGPKYKDGRHNEKELLKSCYRVSLELAKENKCESIAFPLISSGIYGYPKAEALRVAIDAISDFLLENDMLVYIVVFDKKAYEISEKLFTDIEEYIDDNYIKGYDSVYSRERRCNEPEYCESMTISADACVDEADFTLSLEEVIGQVDESFSQMLLRKIDEKGIKDSECYKKANIDRKLFSKIRSDMNYRPSKPTAIAFAIAFKS